jgi:DtxR family transcriptional regulator, Mn-dependent transcriptional regulator
MMSDEVRPSPTIEDYLGVIYTLARDGERVIGARLAESLDVSAPTITATLKRMERDGWIMVAENKTITLTEQGRTMAMSVIRRHMLTEWMLSRVLKLPLSELHREAHHIEHTLSTEVEERLQTEMDDPRCCPHGNPLPGFEDEVSLWQPLSQVSVDQDVVLKRIHENLEDQYESLSFLEANGLTPGTRISIIDRLPFNETMRIMVAGNPVTLGLNLADLLYVESIPDVDQNSG